MEMERNDELSFMDVLVAKVNGGLQRSVHRKPTFTGLYTRWDSFCSSKLNTNLIRTITQRATKICSTAGLSQEFDNLHDIFHENGYPEGVVEKVIRSVLLQGDDSVPRVMQNDDRPVVFMRLPWIGTVSDRFCREIEYTIGRLANW